MTLLLAFLALTSLAVPAPEASPSPSPAPSQPSVEVLYRSILPGPIGDPEAPATEVPGGQTPARAGVSDDDAARGGLRLGRVRLTPGFDVFYAWAEGSFLDTAEPVEDRYFEMRPRIGGEMPVSTGFLRGAYQATIRRGSSFDLVESTITHLADLSIELPIGSIGEITGAEHIVRGVLETAEVDPGREYFFRLGRFSRRRHGLGLRLGYGGRADVALGASREVVRVDDRAAFFDHEEEDVFAQVGYELTPVVRAALGYGYTRIPFTIERPQAESHGHSVFGELRGEILPLTTGSVSVGYSSETSPNAGPGGTRFTGLTTSGRLEKSFTPSSSLTVAGTRATNPSNFEQNAFYVTSAVEAILRAGLPWSVALQAGAGYHHNDYRTVASSIGAPRRDEIRGFTLGLGRPVTRHAFVRADYRRERRDSNIDAFDSHSNVLTVQLGIGLYSARPQ